jgi:hypothetical protein
MIYGQANGGNDRQGDQMIPAKEDKGSPGVIAGEEI